MLSAIQIYAQVDKLFNKLSHSELTKSKCRQVPDPEEPACSITWECTNEDDWATIQKLAPQYGIFFQRNPQAETKAESENPHIGKGSGKWMIARVIQYHEDW